jgi:hypothetical protein
MQILLATVLTLSLGSTLSAFAAAVKTPEVARSAADHGGKRGENESFGSSHRESIAVDAIGDHVAMAVALRASGASAQQVPGYLTDRLKNMGKRSFHA